MSTPVRSGGYRHRISIQRSNEIPDGRGGFTTQIVTVCSRIAALVEPLAGLALVRAQQIDPRNTYAVTMRYQNDISARQTLIYHARGGDKTFEITSVNDDEEMHRELNLLCKEAA